MSHYYLTVLFIYLFIYLFMSISQKEWLSVAEVVGNSNLSQNKVRRLVKNNINTDKVKKQKIDGKHGFKYLLHKSLIGNVFLEKEKVTIEKRKTSNHIYLIKIKNQNIYKIGIAINVNKRLSELQTANYQKLELYFSKKCNHTKAVEYGLHSKFKDKKIRGEWFLLSDEDLVSIEIFIGFYSN